MAMVGPPGFYIRDDVLYYNASVGTTSRGGRVAAGIDQEPWTNLLKLVYVSSVKILGGTYVAAIAIPYIFNVSVSGSVTTALTGPVFRSGNVSGLGDMFILPFQLFWTSGSHRFGFVPAVIAPTGSYEKDRLLNTGRNYWAFDLAGTYTWLHPTRGYEISLTSGLLFNTENTATDYRTGNEYHLDWTVAQYLSERFGLGLTGYWYQQITDDTGPLFGTFNAGNFTSSGVGLGPAALYIVNIGGRDVSFVGKWLHDVEVENRFKGDLLMLSVGLKL